MENIKSDEMVVISKKELLKYYNKYNDKNYASSSEEREAADLVCFVLEEMFGKYL